MTEVVSCKCGATRGIFDTEGDAICHECYTRLAEAKNIAVHELFEARAKIATLEKELADVSRSRSGESG